MSVLRGVYVKKKILTMYTTFILVLFNSFLSSRVLSETSTYKNIQRFKVIKNATTAAA